MGCPMIRHRHQVLCAWFVLWDLVSTAAAWVAAYWIRFQSGWFAVTLFPVPTLRGCLVNLPVVLVLAVIAFRMMDQYSIHRLRRLREELVTIFKSSALLTLLVMATTFFLRDSYESRITLGLFGALTALHLCITRRLSWAGLRYFRSRGFNQSFAIIIGTGRLARKTARGLRRAHWMGIQVLGFVDDQPSPLTSDLNILGSFADLPELVHKHRVGNIFIALPMKRYNDARRVFNILSKIIVEVRLVADVPALAGLSFTTTTIDGLPLIGLRESPHFGLNVVVKRVMDIVLSLFALLVFSPLMLVIGAIIKLSSKGPVFYRQERCGLNGRTFEMLKFRSMRVDAEAQTGAVWAKENDPRRTKFGTFLRKTSLDELPQFINVLKGDMSLVGPRPERPVFIQQFSNTIPNYMARHAVKAGITGWAQVNGWRGNTSLRKRVQYDLYYIAHWTPMLDLRILWMTVWHGLVNRHAY
jgi:Undecaprenyl-phosphate glucose phosphotransferase